MSKPAPVFRPISAPLDVPDEALNALGDRLGVPTMVKPEQPPAPIPAAAPAPTPAARYGAQPAVATPVAAVQSPAALKAAEAPAHSQIEGPSPQEKLTIELPAYLAQALRRDCAERRLTQRYLVLQGLQAIGYAIEPADLVPDHRRPKAKAG